MYLGTEASSYQFELQLATAAINCSHELQLSKPSASKIHRRFCGEPRALSISLRVFPFVWRHCNSKPLSCYFTCALLYQHRHILLDADSRDNRNHNARQRSEDPQRMQASSTKPSPSALHSTRTHHTSFSPIEKPCVLSDRERPLGPPRIVRLHY
jgi:hypothetical protein